MNTLRQAYDALLAHPFANGLIPHLLTVVGFILALLAIARLLSERRQPGNTFAWLLAIAFVPYLGVPLYLLLGGRKIKRLLATKPRLRPLTNPEQTPATPMGPTARVLSLNGASPPLGGNRLRLLTTGEAAFAELEHGIKNARHSIQIMTFILARDAVGRRLVALLAQRACEGVRVQLLLDALGCFPSSGRFVEPIRAAGGQVAKFMPVLPLQTRGSANLRNHRKLAIFDGHTALLGGHNLAKEYMGPTPLRKRWRDFGARIEGPAVRPLQDTFLADWAFATKQTPAAERAAWLTEFPPAVGDSELQIVASGPDVAGDPLYEGILSLVQNAERSIWIVTPYFIPDEVLFRSLLLKARGGLDVRIIVPARSNHPVTDLARRHFLRELKAAGATVLLYQPGMSHTKLMLVDGSTALFGSANMDLRSLFVNFEIAALTYSPADATAIAANIEEIAAQAKPLTEPRRKRRFWSVVGEEIARLLAPLL
jgi:cardiolipin synthase A/B